MKTATFLSCICLLALQAVAGSEPNALVQFPDTNLERVVREELRLQPTNQIYDVDVRTITTLNAADSLITDSSGIETLTALRTLNFTTDRLTKLDVSARANLETLLCKDNRLANLNVSDCSDLRAVWCMDNQLTNLNVSDCANLQVLDCANNKLSVLDISSDRALTYVGVTGNPITNILVWWTPPTATNIPLSLTLYYDGNPTFSNPK
jgi:hypothetical protein